MRRPRIKLSEEENRQLIEAAQHGDTLAEERLVICSAGIVYQIAMRYRKKYEYEPPEDLFQIGNEGLIKAIRRFDLDSGYKFTTYAVPTVDGQIRKYLRDKATLLKVPRHINVAAVKIHQLELYDSPIEEVMDKLNIDRATAVDAQHFAKYQVASLNESLSVREGAESVTLMEMIADEKEKDWFDGVAIREALRVLDAREQKVVEMRYFKDHTQSEIAKLIGVSQVHVSRIEKKALEKLKDQLIEV